MSAITYHHFPAEGGHTEREMTFAPAYASIGQRVAMGFPVVQRYYEDREGAERSVTYFQSDHTGAVWAVYDFGG